MTIPWRWPAILGIAFLAAASLRAAPRYAALGASDAVGVGASNYNEADPAQPNNGYVYLIHGWMRARYPYWNLSNLGVSGATAPTIAADQLQPAILLNPDVVTVWAGGNDVKNSVLAGEETEALRARFELSFTSIIQRLRGETTAVVVVANLPDMSRLPVALLLSADVRKRAKASSIALNEVIAAVCAANAVPVVDVYGDPETYAWGNYSWDGFHPNDAGYEKLAAKFQAILRRDAWRVVSGLGDVDGDGEVGAQDVALALGSAGGLNALTDRAAVAADVIPNGGNGAATITDATLLLRRIHSIGTDGALR